MANHSEIYDSTQPTLPILWLFNKSALVLMVTGDLLCARLATVDPLSYKVNRRFPVTHNKEYNIRDVLASGIKLSPLRL